MTARVQLLIYQRVTIVNHQVIHSSMMNWSISPVNPVTPQVMHALVESSLWTLALSVYDQLQRRASEPHRRGIREIRESHGRPGPRMVQVVAGAGNSKKSIVYFPERTMWNSQDNSQIAMETSPFIVELATKNNFHRPFSIAKIKMRSGCVQPLLVDDQFRDYRIWWVATGVSTSQYLPVVRCYNGLWPPY
jgi:hypothetical protein